MAALREALEMAKVAIEAAKKKMGVDNPMILEIIDEALALPRRNCDVGTAEEQTVRYDKFCKTNKTVEKCCTDCPALGTADCELVWAQMPYAEGGAK